MPLQQIEEAIAAFYELYPDVYVYLERCKQEVIDPGWMRTPWGRRRRFKAATDDEALLAAQQREACNYR